MKKRRQSIQGARWRRLDNTAKIFPVIANENLSNVYRVSATLKKAVQPLLLERALKEVLPVFEGFGVKLRRGFFWYYFETNKQKPVVEKESTYPCKFIDPHSSHLYLFRVSYFEKRINLEVFHALTDGMGAMNFLKALTCRYLELARGDGADPSHGEGEEVCGGGLPAGMDVSDSYLNNYEKRKRRKYVTAKAYQLSGEYLPLDGQNIIHGYMDLDALKARCRQSHVSITKFFTALLIWSIYQVYLEGKPWDQMVAVNLPVNLRAFFDSETNANFFAVTMIGFLFEHPDVDFGTVLEEVSRQMDDKIVKEKLAETISYNVSNEKKWYIRIMPLFVKYLGLNLAFLKSSKAHTVTLSNLGPVEIPKEYRDGIQQFQVVIGVSRRQKMKLGICAYGGKISVTFNSIFDDMKLQNFFFHFLEKEGIPVQLESNGNPDREHDRGTYPQIGYDTGKLKKMMNLFYAMLLAVAAILAVVNVASFHGVWWSVIAIAGIAYVAITLRYSVMRRSNLAFKLVVQSVGAQALLIIIDYMTGYRGWSVNYAIPGMILFDDIAVVGLIVVNRLNWQSYFMYQLSITVFSLVPLALWAFHLITKPIMAVITVIISVTILCITYILGDRSVKNELIRRFHL